MHDKIKLVFLPTQNPVDVAWGFTFLDANDVEWGISILLHPAFKLSTVRRLVEQKLKLCLARLCDEGLIEHAEVTRELVVALADSYATAVIKNFWPDLVKFKPVFEDARPIETTEPALTES